MDVPDIKKESITPARQKKEHCRRSIDLCFEKNQMKKTKGDTTAKQNNPR
jgi:hypothetical protein